MHVGGKSRLVLWSTFGALACALLVGIRFESRIWRNRGDESKLRSTAAAALAPVGTAASDRILSFEERLRAEPGSNGKNGDARRAAILVEWLASDRKGAMRFLAIDRFRDLRLPGVSRAVGEKADASELLDVAKGAESPGEALYGVGKWAGPAVVNGLANLTPSIHGDAAGPATSAIAGLLADLNLDRAVAFAKSQPTDSMRAAAIGGVFDELRSAANGERKFVLCTRHCRRRFRRPIRSSSPTAMRSGDRIRSPRCKRWKA